ncbi:MAG: XRE family transcriptional regulator [Caulobacteraceae bacterium]|nr:XRE family transcriptional regulator [Caulobacteraceae bacterium]
MRQRQRRPIFLREWRKHRGYTVEQLADRLHIHKGQLSKIERGLRPYTQDFLEAASECLQTDPASLIMRNPADADAIWSIWESLPEVERPQALRMLGAFLASLKAAGDNK